MTKLLKGTMDTRITQFGVPSKKGFTVIELLIVMAIIGILAALSTPRFLHVLKARQTVDCTMKRIVTQNGEWQYVIDFGKPSQSIDELVQKKYLQTYPQCPGGGVYVWMNEASEKAPFRTLGCSLHYFPPQAAVAPLTPLGSTFTEISNNFIELLNGFYKKNGRYARTWGEYTFTDIGLNPLNWKNSISGIIYKPGGNRLSIVPDTGYVFTVTDNKGVQRTLTPDLHWNLVYSLQDKTWYYHSIGKGNEIDISTLKVKKK